MPASATGGRLPPAPHHRPAGCCVAGAPRLGVCFGLRIYICIRSHSCGCLLAEVTLAVFASTLANIHSLFNTFANIYSSDLRLPSGVHQPTPSTRTSHDVALDAWMACAACVRGAYCASWCLKPRHLSSRLSSSSPYHLCTASGITSPLPFSSQILLCIFVNSLHFAACLRMHALQQHFYIHKYYRFCIITPGDHHESGTAAGRP